MSSDDYELKAIPQDKRARELWLQHAAGLIFTEDARNYAIKKINENTDEPTRQKIIEGINDALYGVMMILDGVSGNLDNERYSVSLETKVTLIKKDTGAVIDEVNLTEGDGMCMGYHDWLEGDFGEDPVAAKK
ncbi:hypothetical protein [Hahella ganghwensis]|uniref:hypothetical protein n=1 Tax=Hahella ganghwensis TaxID=286420 RepID=UPI000370A4A7|nr:hypothetical protein [Hahella ganghwensis]